MSSSSRFVGCAHYGEKPTQLSPVESMRFIIYDFLNLPQKQGEYLDTPALVAHGISWKLRIFPKESRHSGDFISCFLYCLDVSRAKQKNPNVSIKSICTFEFGNSTGSNNATTSNSRRSSLSTSSEASLTSYSKKFSDVTFSAKQSRLGWYDMYKRPSNNSEIAANLLDQEGSLVVDVHIQIYGRSTWYPKPINKHDILEKLLASPLGSDIHFTVGNNETSQARETFHAHSCILVHRAPILYELVQDTASSNKDEGPFFDIPFISPSIFKILLLYIYTGAMPDTSEINNADTAKDLLLSADRFGCTQLKLYVESEMTAKLLNVDNAAEWLSLADSHSCPLLKEACMNLYMNNPAEVMANSEGWSKVQESLPLVTALLQFATKRSLPCHDKDYDNFTVRTLRETLEKYDLSLDGTKEMLTKRLKDYHSHDYESNDDQEEDDDDSDNDAETDDIESI